MSQSSDPASLLADILDGRLMAAGVAPAVDDAQALARLAARCRGLSPAGPNGAARARMESRFTAYIETRSTRSYGWLAPLPRTRMQRMAAGAVLMVGLGSGAVAANPSTFVDLASNAVGLVHNIALNLSPAGSAGDGGPGLTPETSLSPAPTEERTPTPVPPATPTQSPSPTPAGAETATAEATPAANPAATPEATVVARAEPTSTAAPEPPEETPSAEPEDTATATPTPSSTPSPTATVTPRPSSTPSPTATPTPKPKPKPEPDEEDDD